MTGKDDVGEDTEIEVVGHQPPLIPEGIYTMQFDHHSTALVFQTPKVFLHFRIADLGPYARVGLFRAYRVRNLKGKPRKRGGSFVLGRRSDLYYDLCRLGSHKVRPDRPTLDIFRNRYIETKVRTVKFDYKQRPLPEEMQYSVIDSLHRFVTGGTPCPSAP